jgi:hypothetical protein
MSTARMTERGREASPRLKARIAGFLYLIIIVAGMFAELFVREKLVVHGDAMATAQNILAHELLYRWGFAAGIIVLFCAIPLLLILYDFFKVVNRSLALLAVFFNLVSIAMEGANLLNHFAPLILLRGGPYLSAFKTEQLHALAYLSLRLQSTGYDMSLAFFGCFCLVAGYLIFRSAFLPRIIGVLMAIAGLCYLTNSFTNFLAPQFSKYVFPYILAPGLVGEGSLTLWLLVMGVNVERWKEQASAAAMRT